MQLTRAPEASLVATADGEGELEEAERPFQESRPLHDAAVRHMILDGLGDDGVARLGELSYAIVTKLDPQRRLAVTAGHPGPGRPPGPAPDTCPADPGTPPTGSDCRHRPPASPT